MHAQTPLWLCIALHGDAVYILQRELGDDYRLYLLQDQKEKPVVRFAQHLTTSRHWAARCCSKMLKRGAHIAMGACRRAP